MGVIADPYADAKALVARLRQAQYSFEPENVRQVLAETCSSDVLFRMCFPMNDLVGPEAFYTRCCGPLFEAWPNLERRDWIVMAGLDDDGAVWVGCGGHYLGTSVRPWLDIPPTGHIMHMRFHEFYRVADDKIVEMQAIWDIPEVMMQAGVWPMSPSLGREFLVPGPATCDGIQTGGRDDALSRSSLEIVISMLMALKNVPDHPEEKMDMPRYWHERMNWYGPAGTGANRGHRGFRNWHQIPFVAAMPDRGKYPHKVRYHFLAENNYVGVTGWPNMHQTLSADGWYGIAPVGKKIDMRSLDFWRLEMCPDGERRIRENWVLWDMLDVYHQLGVDVFAQMRELARPYARQVPDEIWKQS